MMVRLPTALIRGLLGLSVLTLAHCSSAGAGTAALALPAQGAATASTCGAASQVGFATCDAILRTDVGTPTAQFARRAESLRTIEMVPPGLGPADLARAYAYSTSGGVGQTIGIVDAYDDPTIEQDIATYRTYYNLPACTTANGCFKKRDQDGSANFPAVNLGWSAEIAVDTEVASAVCPNCKIVLIEANSASMSDLALAVDQAVAQGATVISNSFGAPEWSGETSLDSHWNHPGVVITASSGDNGYGVQFPAASAHVIAVGGTVLQRSTNARGYEESAWGLAGSGCSQYIGKPVWQKDSACSKRTVSDISFDASPNSPVSIYQSTCSGRVCGWIEYGGTSVAAPAIAALYALAGNASTQNAAQNLYTHSAGLLTDVVTGSDGNCSSYLCNAQIGYDGPTGLGTPDGLGAF